MLCKEYDEKLERMSNFLECKVESESYNDFKEVWKHKNVVLDHKITALNETIATQQLNTDQAVARLDELIMNNYTKPEIDLILGDLNKLNEDTYTTQNLFEKSNSNLLSRISSNRENIEGIVDNLKTHVDKFMQIDKNMETL